MTVKQLMALLDRVENKESEVHIIHDTVTLGTIVMVAIDLHAETVTIGN